MGIRWNILVIMSVFIQSFSILIFKLGSYYTAEKTYLFFVSGVCLEFVRAYLWQLILLKKELSAVYPYTSFVQVLIFIYSIVLFDEKVHGRHFLGLALIVIGVFIFSKGIKETNS